MNVQVIDSLKGILVDLGISRESIHENTRLQQDLQLDSTETVELALGLKRQLGVSIKLETRQDLTIAQVCQLIEAAMATSSR